MARRGPVDGGGGGGVFNDNDGSLSSSSKRYFCMRLNFLSSVISGAGKTYCCGLEADEVEIGDGPRLLVVISGSSKLFVEEMEVLLLAPAVRELKEESEPPTPLPCDVDDEENKVLIWL